MKTYSAAALVFVCLLLAVSMLTGPALGRELTIITHDSFSMSESVLKILKRPWVRRSQFFAPGDAGQALNKAILSKNNPMADLFYGWTTPL